MKQKKFDKYVAAYIEEGFREGADSFVADLTAAGVNEKRIQSMLESFYDARPLPSIARCEITDVKQPTPTTECQHRLLFGHNKKKHHFFKIVTTSPRTADLR